MLDSLEPFAKAIESIHCKVSNKQQKPDITRIEDAHANKQYTITGIDDGDDDDDDHHHHHHFYIISYVCKHII